MSNIVIRDVRAICTAPYGINLVIVKVETSEPGLYGVGCATFTQRYLTVCSEIENYIKPFLIGKEPERIEDIWHSAMVSSYWRNCGVLNNALSGVDMALWDIKGKLAGMPVYQLLGGKVREAAAVYCHTDGRDEMEVEERVRQKMEEGYRHIRCQMGGYGGDGNTIHKPDNALAGSYFCPDSYVRSVPRLFEHLRKKLGFGIELLHDVHERVAPIEAVRLAKQMEQYRLFFLEDLLSPEQAQWFDIIRNQCSTPIAMGELFNNPSEWTPLIKNRLIDFIRVHVSQIGGITPAKKLAALCGAYGIRTAWHGPGDVSPIGHSANIHLDVSSHNFGIQEWAADNESDVCQEVFPGCLKVRNGHVYPNDRPGLGIDINEKEAAKYPCKNILPEWTLARLPDGTSVCP